MNEMDILREDRRRLVEDLKLVVRDTESILRHKVSDAGQGYTEARDRLERTLQDAKSEVERLEKKAVDTARSAAHETNEYVHRHPWETSGVGMGVGVGVGVLLGLIVGRR